MTGTPGRWTVPGGPRADNTFDSTLAAPLRRRQTLSPLAGSIGRLVVGPLAGQASGNEADPPCFIEDDMVDGVRAVALSQFIGLHARVCRPASLTAADVQRVVEHAVARIGDQYDLRKFVDLVRYLITTPPVPLAWRRRLLVLGSPS